MDSRRILGRAGRAALLGSALVSSAWAGDWEFGGGLLFAELAGRTYGQGLETDEFFRGGHGLDASFRRRVSAEAAVELGANTVLFDGKRGGDAGGLNAAPGELAAHALYAGIRFEPPADGGVSFHARLDAGVSYLEDVRHEAARAGTELGSETAFRGGEDLYLGAGLGLAFRASPGWRIDLGWELRRYGRLAGESDPAQKSFPTRDLVVTASGIRVGATYRF